MNLLLSAVEGIDFSLFHANHSIAVRVHSSFRRVNCNGEQS
jgi:hypothetical protein